jgi:hypothetical protein
VPSISSIEPVTIDVDLPSPLLYPIYDFIPHEPELLEPLLLPLLPPTLTASRWPYYECRLLRRFTDNLPGALAPALLPHKLQPEAGATRSVHHVLLIVQDKLVTIANLFGVWHDYPYHPIID